MPEVNYSYGIGTTTDVSSYLKTVQVEIDLYREKAVGNAIFVIENESEINEDIDLYFDPGMEATSVAVKVDGYPVGSHAEFVDELTELQQEYSHSLHDVTVFAATVEGFSSTRIEIDWEAPSSDSSGYGTQWETGYLIIATRAWELPIDSVEVIFDVHCDEFAEYEVNYTPTNVSLNEEELPVIEYQFINFSETERLLKVTGKYEKNPGPPPDCFIATAAYGSPMEPQVKVLREFRDRFLLTNKVGKAFVGVYYAYLPPVADFISKHDTLRAVVSWSLLPVVGVSWVALKLGPVPSLALVLLLGSGVVGIVGFSWKKLKK